MSKRQLVPMNCAECGEPLQAWERIFLDHEDRKLNICGECWVAQQVEDEPDVADASGGMD